MSQFLFRNAVEEAELLLYQIDVFFPVEQKFVLVVLSSQLGDGIDAANDFVGRLPCPRVRRYLEPGLGGRRVFLRKCRPSHSPAA
ncbi:hypothetical protein [Lysobacter sp. 1R34A]|uniref:hypothetical protein n=1 Tax=Lysobacter sp. 1R34A TaxID=3445786 RepID=UPI003EEBDE2C